MMNQAAPEVNSIIVNNIRLSLIQFLPAMGLLKARQSAAVPFSFLFSGAEFRRKFTEALNAGTSLRPPWRDSYGKLFWARYLPAELRTEYQAWRALVPLDYDFVHKDSGPPLKDCQAQVRTYLYPWGIGLIVDFGCKGPMPLFDAVDRAFEAQRKARGMLQSILKGVRADAYADASKETAGNVFSIVTIVDATGVSPEVEIDPKGPIARAIEGLAGWNPSWRNMQLEDLEKGAITIRQSPAGHMLYGKERGRVVWFPDNFRSTDPFRYRGTLACYHQNLTVASLHAESLCQIAQDAAAELNKTNALAPFSATYVETARLSGGLLGRLHGRRDGVTDKKKPETYRSGSVRTQILVYKDDVNTVRNKLVIPPSALDA